jgi:hypothetical protein
MAAVLGSFATALLIRRAAHVSTSIEVLAVALSLSLGRIGQRHEHRGLRARLLALALVPVLAVCANEIGTVIVHHQTLGDALFVLAISTTIWIRRFGQRARRIATLATLPLVAMLIAPAPVAAAGGVSQALWSALTALVALAWVTLTQELGERSGFVPAEPAALTAVRAPAPAPARTGGGRRRLAGTTKLAVQMGAALSAAFAAGRELFGVHWTWTVLTAFIVSSGAVGREDVAHKAGLRILGAGAGTAAATVITGMVPAGDDWAIVALFGVLAIGTWLRPLNYAFWATAVTGALALLYGYYGERGSGLLASRLEAIVLGAAFAVASAWLLMPIRVTDVIRRDVAAALAALDAYLEGLMADEPSTPALEEHFRRTVVTLERHGGLLRAIPRRLRAPIDHLPAIDGLERCAEVVPSITAAGDRAGDGSGDEPGGGPGADPGRARRVGQLRRELGTLRARNRQAALPDATNWDAFIDGLSAVVAPGAPAPPPPTATGNRSPVAS